MSTERIQYLFKQYEQGLATGQEIEELAKSDEDLVREVIVKGLEGEKEVELVRAEWDPVVATILSAMPGEEPEDEEKKFRRVRMFRWVTVAAVILILGVSGWYLLNRGGTPPPPNPETAEQRFKNDVQPGTNQPTLTLADGRKVLLDSTAHSSQLATQGSVIVRRLPDGTIVYDGTTAGREIKYNTITNPGGSKVVTLKLADGSQVWLDAASSITYPTAFTGKERGVTMTGQAYFEVAHNARMPFVVRKENEDVAIRVLGTHFNVMAFEDEGSLRVTLLEGSVEVKMKNEKLKISPGEQARVDRANKTITVAKDNDIEGTMAWKNGVFKFQDITIEALMKQLARWYDVEVVFEGKVDEHFVSTIPRDVPASQVFRILETTGRVRFKIEGKKVTVMK